MKKRKKKCGILIFLCVLIIVVPTFVYAGPAISLNKSKATISVGKSLSLKVKGTKKKGIYSSSNKAVASVTRKGKVTGKKAGKATITVKIGKKKYKCKVTVKKKTELITEEKTQTTENRTSSKATTEKKQEATTQMKTQTTQQVTTQEKVSENQLEVIVGSKTFTVTLYQKKAVEELKKKLPMTLSMSELNGNEKYCYMKDAFTQSVDSGSSIKSGDFVLYGSRCLVLFYDNFSTTYQYTTLGYMKDAAGLKDALGSGNVTVTLQMKE